MIKFRIIARTAGATSVAAGLCLSLSGCLEGAPSLQLPGYVEADITAGRLVSVLDDFAAPPNGIFALFPQRKHLALRVRLWIDFLKHHYGQPDFWSVGRV